MGQLGHWRMSAAVLVLYDMSCICFLCMCMFMLIHTDVSVVILAEVASSGFSWVCSFFTKNSFCVLRLRLVEGELNCHRKHCQQEYKYSIFVYCACTHTTISTSCSFTSCYANSVVWSYVWIISNIGSGSVLFSRACLLKVAGARTQIYGRNGCRHATRYHSHMEWNLRQLGGV